MNLTIMMKLDLGNHGSVYDVPIYNFNKLSKKKKLKAIEDKFREFDKLIAEFPKHVQTYIVRVSLNRKEQSKLIKSIKSEKKVYIAGSDINFDN